MRAFLLLSLGVVVVVGLSNPAGAVAAASAVQDSLPYANLYTPDEIRQGFYNRQVTPFGDRAFYFEILIPKDWDSRPLTVTREQLAQDTKTSVPMAEFAPHKGPENLLIQVGYIRAPASVSLEHFVDVYAKAFGVQILARQRGEFSGRQVEDALFKKDTTNLGPMLIRFTASRRGELIFVVAGSTTEGQYQKYKRIFAAAAVSFNPSGK